MNHSAERPKRFKKLSTSLDVASRQEPRGMNAEGVVSEPSIGEVDFGQDVLYLNQDDGFDKLSAESIEQELEEMPANSRFYLSPEVFAAVLERETGQHQPWMYDTPEEERPDNPDLPDFVPGGVEKVADILSSLPAESGRIDVKLYEREGDPQYLRTHEGEVSDQLFERFERALAPRTDYDLEPAEDGYVLEL